MSRLLFGLCALLTLVFLSGRLGAQEWEEGFPVRISYQELEGEDYGSADVTLMMTFPVGTPLLARETALGSALSALQDIWNVESVHEDVRGFLGPVIPMDVQRAVSQISGAAFIVALTDEFETVGDAGYSRFQTDVQVANAERIEIPRRSSGGQYPDAPRFFAWVIGNGWPEGETGHENWVIASLVNYSASVLSFRSELGRFPDSLADLREAGHVLIEPLNPYNGEPVREVTSASAGNISYQYIDNNRVVLMTWIRVGDQLDMVRREINVSPAGAYDLLYRQTAGLSETDKQVARYIFQISQILNEYYYQNLDLPYRVPQCEAEGFAYVSFLNPYTQDDVQQADSLATITAGDYRYSRISSSSYFLIGYGGQGQGILSISKDFSESGLELGTLRTR